MIRTERSEASINAYIKNLEALGVKYKVRHSQYSTKIMSNLGNYTMTHMELSKKTFVAYNKIRRDVLQSEAYASIIDKTYLTENYDYDKNRLRYISDNGVYNMDITSAYAHTLLLHGFITGETFDYITRIPKHERLICVGMLARSYTEFIYNDKGEATDVNFHREATSNVFFFLIQEIDAVMKECAYVLGKHFIFYWVDGIFFERQTPAHKIKQVEEIFNYYGYPYKWENVEYFQYELSDDEENINVRCLKNDEWKEYIWGVDKSEKDIKRYLNNKYRYAQKST